MECKSSGLQLFNAVDNAGQAGKVEKRKGGWILTARHRHRRRHSRTLARKEAGSPEDRMYGSTEEAFVSSGGQKRVDIASRIGTKVFFSFLISDDGESIRDGLFWFLYDLFAHLGKYYSPCPLRSEHPSQLSYSLSPLSSLPDAVYIYFICPRNRWPSHRFLPPRANQQTSARSLPPAKQRKKMTRQKAT